MSDHFLHSCKRRSILKKGPADAGVPLHAIPGAGSGGGPGDGNHSHYFDGTYSIAANRVEIASQPPLPPAIPSDFVISLFAGGMGDDGRVEVHGSQGVRLTAGPPNMPSASSSGTNGAEIMVGEMQNVTIQRGLIEGVDQQILMAPGSIMVDGGVGDVTIKSLTSITLQVADGLSSITMTPAGITMQGILVMIN